MISTQQREDNLTSKKKNSKRFEQIFHQKKMWMANKYIKRCSKSLTIRKIQLKSKWYTTIYLPELLKLQRLTIPTIGKGVEQL